MRTLTIDGHSVNRVPRYPVLTLVNSPSGEAPVPDPVYADALLHSMGSKLRYDHLLVPIWGPPPARKLKVRGLYALNRPSGIKLGTVLSLVVKAALLVSAFLIGVSLVS